MTSSFSTAAPNHTTEVPHQNQHVHRLAPSFDPEERLSAGRLTFSTARSSLLFPTSGGKNRHSSGVSVFSTQRSLSPIGAEPIQRQSQMAKRRSSQLDNIVRRMSFLEMSKNNSSILPSLPTDVKNYERKFRSSLLSLLSNQSTNKATPHICSGTINGRGSFVRIPARERQNKFNSNDSLEHVLQSYSRLRLFYTFLKEKCCSEILEFWSIVELYQNLYWKPFKLLGIELQIKRMQPIAETTQNKGATLAGPAEDDDDEDEDEDEKDGRSAPSTLAHVLNKFTLDEEIILRDEIIGYYIADDAPSEICMPSQMRYNILQIMTPRFAQKYDREDRLSLFRHAQKFCYNELQLEMPMFLQYEQQQKQEKEKEKEEEGEQQQQQHTNQEDVRQHADLHSPALAAMESSLLATGLLSLRRLSASLPVNEENEPGTKKNQWGW